MKVQSMWGEKGCRGRVKPARSAISSRPFLPGLQDAEPPPTPLRFPDLPDIAECTSAGVQDELKGVVGGGGGG